MFAISFDSDLKTDGARENELMRIGRNGEMILKLNGISRKLYSRSSDFQQCAKWRNSAHVKICSRLKRGFLLIQIEHFKYSAAAFMQM